MQCCYVPSELKHALSKGFGASKACFGYMSVLCWDFLAKSHIHLELQFQSLQIDSCQAKRTEDPEFPDSIRALWEKVVPGGCWGPLFARVL